MLLSLALSLSPFLVVILVGLLILATDGPLQAETRYAHGFGPPGLKRRRLRSESSAARAMMASIRTPTTSAPRTLGQCSSTARPGKPTSRRNMAGPGQMSLDLGAEDWRHISPLDERSSSAAAVGSHGVVGHRR